MSLLDEEDPPPTTPAWMLTFGDMMGLLLTFFILLVSMSEIREDDRFQGISDSIQERFGYEDGLKRIPGESHPRHALLASLTMTGRQWRTISSSDHHRDGSLVLQGTTTAQREELRRWTKTLRPNQQVEIHGQSPADQLDTTFHAARDILRILTDDLKLDAQRVSITMTESATNTVHPLEVRVH